MIKVSLALTNPGYRRRKSIRHETAMVRLLYLLVVCGYCLSGSHLLFEHATEIWGGWQIRRGERSILQRTRRGHGEKGGFPRIRGEPRAYLKEEPHLSGTGLLP